jgi:hypothetical protein
VRRDHLGYRHSGHGICRADEDFLRGRSLARSGNSSPQKHAVQHSEYRHIQKDMQRTVWVSGCKSGYQNANGQIDALWPGYTWEYWLTTRRFQVSDYL